MMFYLAAALLTFCVLALLALSMLGARADKDDNSQASTSVYKAQLAEIERDLDSGTLSPADAESARIEISRRLIAASEMEARAQGAHGANWSAFAMVAISISVLTAGGYYFLGANAAPDQPLSARIHAPAETSDIEVLIAQVEKHLADDPEDVRGWTVVAPVYLRLGRYDDAATAYSNVNRLGDPTARTENGLGEALVGRADGMVTEDARAAFERALKHDPASIRARFFLAIADQQDGRNDDAIARWQELLKEPNDPEGAWRVVAQQKLAELGATGPSAAEVEAAAAMDPNDRAAMIRSMVDGLAERLADDPNDLEGWLRLMQAYTVLGEADAATDALEKARSAFNADKAGLARIEAAANELGIGS